MQANTLKLTAIAAIGTIAVAALFINKATEQQTRENRVDKFLSQADTVLNQKLDNGNAAVRLPVKRSNLPAGHPPVAKSSPHKVTAGNQDHFLQVTLSDDWQAIEQGEGIASLRFKLNLQGSSKEMAVIRMNKEVPLDTVINIWKQKVGLAPDATVKYQPFSNKDDQQMYIAELKGPYKTIMLAIHKGEKYTFFRLSGNHQYGEQTWTAFKSFLSGARIMG